MKTYSDNRRPDPRYYSEVFWHGPGWYAWRTRADVQRWYQVGKAKSEAEQPIMQEILRQQQLIGLVWVDEPNEFKASYVENLQY